MNSASRLTRVQWLICAIAAIGFAFDIYEMLMLPLIVRPALLELTGAVPGSPEFQMWVGRLFYIPAFAGGIFGLLGGYLTDRLGRRRVLTWSILLYAVSAFAVGLLDVDRDAAGAPLHRVHRRVRRVRRRRRLAGGAVPRARSAGKRCSAIRRRSRRSAACWSRPSTALCVAYAASLAGDSARFGLEIARPARALALHADVGRDPGDSADSHSPVPAGVAGLAAEEGRRHARAAEHRRDCSAPELRRTTIVTTIMFACAYGAAFGAIQQMPQIVPGLPEVRQLTSGPAAAAAPRSSLRRWPPTSRRSRRSAGCSGASSWRIWRSSSSAGGS